MVTRLIRIATKSTAEVILVTTVPVCEVSATTTLYRCGNQSDDIDSPKTMKFDEMPRPMNGRTVEKLNVDDEPFCKGGLIAVLARQTCGSNNLIKEAFAGVKDGKNDALTIDLATELPYDLLLMQNGEHQAKKDLYMKNAIMLRQKHWERVAKRQTEDLKAKQARLAITKYIQLSQSMGYPIDFSQWLIGLQQTVLFEKKVIPPSKNFAPVIASVKPLTSILPLEDKNLIQIMVLLDYPSIQSLRMSAKKFSHLYMENRTTICEAILLRTKGVLKLRGLQSKVEEDPEYRLRRHHYSVDWIARSLLDSFQKVRAVCDRSLATFSERSLLSKAYHTPQPMQPFKPPEILNGKTYPFPGLVKYMLERNLGNPRRSKVDLPRYSKALTMLEKKLFEDLEDAKECLVWTIRLLRDYLASNRVVYYSINEYMAKEGQEDCLASEEEYCAFIKALKPAEVWELVRLVPLEYDGLGHLEIEAVETNTNTDEDDMDRYEKLVLTRVKHIIKG